MYYKQFHKSFAKWLPKVRKVGSWRWANRLACWKGWRDAELAIQIEIAAQLFVETRIQDEVKNWAKAWIKSGGFHGELAGRVGQVGEPFEIKKKSVLLTYQVFFWDASRSVGGAIAQEGRSCNPCK